MNSIRHNLWFSEMDRRRRDRERLPVLFGKLENGDVVEYTEMTITGIKPNNSDAELLGIGEYHHTQK